MTTTRAPYSQGGYDEKSEGRSKAQRGSPRQPRKRNTHLPLVPTATPPTPPSPESSRSSSERNSPTSALLDSTTPHHHHHHHQPQSSSKYSKTSPPPPSMIQGKRKKEDSYKSAWHVGSSFMPRSSRLEILRSNSMISQSEFWGFLIMLNVFAVASTVLIPLFRWHEKGAPFDMELAHRMFHDFYLVMSMWAGSFTVAFAIYFWYNFYLRFHHSSLLLWLGTIALEVVMLTISAFVPLKRNWPFVPSGFCVMVTITHFMKMHSFVATNWRFEQNKNNKKRCPYYPQNISLSNFGYFMFAPTLVYEPFYPRTDKMEFGYCSLKLVGMFGAMMGLYILISDSIKPLDREAYALAIWEVLLRNILPYFLAVILIFFLVFECLLNLFAEVTYFADRDFYQDWWNSKNWPEFGRKWNRVVYEWLKRHVYLPLTELGLSRYLCGCCTILFSAFFHELVLSVCFRFIRPYMTGLMLFQIPWTVAMSITERGWYGNVSFWLSILMGVPLLGTVYCREWRRLETLGLTHPPII